MNRENKEILADMFNSVDVVGSVEVARATGLSEAATRAFADELGVNRIGNSYAWTENNVSDLLSTLEDEEVDEEEDDDGEDDDDEDEEDEDEEDEDGDDE